MPRLNAACACFTGGIVESDTREKVLQSTLNAFEWQNEGGFNKQNNQEGVISKG